MKGWYKDSHRHYLAAKGIKTKKYQRTPLEIYKVPCKHRKKSCERKCVHCGVEMENIDGKWVATDVELEDENESKAYMASKMNDFDHDRLKQHAKHHSEEHIMLMRKKMKQGASFDEAHAYASEAEKEDVMGLPRQENVGILGLDEALQAKGHSSEPQSVGWFDFEKDKQKGYFAKKVPTYQEYKDALVRLDRVTSMEQRKKDVETINAFEKEMDKKRNV